jgi:hypothetical protein
MNRSKPQFLLFKNTGNKLFRFCSVWKPEGGAIKKKPDYVFFNHLAKIRKDFNALE